MQTTTTQVAKILDECAKERGFDGRLEFLGGLMNDLLCAEAIPRLSDADVYVAQDLLDRLIARCPQAVAVAQGDTPGMTVVFDPIALGM